MKSPLNRRGLRYCLVLIALVRGAATYTTILSGIPVIVLGAALHFWAKGCLRQNKVVATGGPYRFVRHPFYLANALIDAGIAVMSGWWVLEAVLPFWWLGVYIPVMRQEEEYLLGAFGPIYEDYRRRVPRLVPYRWPLAADGGGFRWTNPNITADVEIPRTIRILAYPLLFFVVTDLRALGWSYFHDAWRPATLAGLVLLYAIAWALARWLRGRGKTDAASDRMSGE